MGVEGTSELGAVWEENLEGNWGDGFNWFEFEMGMLSEEAASFTGDFSAIPSLSLLSSFLSFSFNFYFSCSEKFQIFFLGIDFSILLKEP